jgi:hypothetical protein
MLSFLQKHESLIKTLKALFSFQSKTLEIFDAHKSWPIPEGAHPHSWLTDLFSDIYPYMLKFEVIITILNKRHEYQNGEEDSPNAEIKENIRQFTQMFEGITTLAVTTSFATALKFKGWYHFEDRIKPTISQIRMQKIKPHFDFVLPLVVKHYESLVESLCLYPEDMHESDWVHVLVAFWFSIMTHEQFKQLLTK